MEIPDKIYIPYYPNYDGIDTHLSDEWFEGKAIDHVEGWVEYIRKGALLEKIDEILNAKPDGGLAVDIAAQALVDIKKVINSM